MSSARRSNLLALAIALLAVVALLGARAALVPTPLERLAPGEGARGARGAQDEDSGDAGWVTLEGSWLFPRGGPYILGYETPGNARLYIDGRRVLAGAGQQSTRRVYEAGVRALRFEFERYDGGAADAADAADAVSGAGALDHLSETRLLWHPPGRRGPLEYVPPSSLAPEPPERADFGRWAGASPLDGLISALILALLVALALFWARASLARADRGALLWGALVLALALGVRLWDLGGAGQTWDEDVNWSAGRNYVSNWLALDFRPASWTWNYEHPPVMKYIAGIGAQWADGYGPARALSAAMMALACALLVGIGRRLYGLRVGVVAGVVAALSPHLVAHGKIVGHEAPSVLWWALGIWLALRAYDRPASASVPASDEDGAGQGVAARVLAGRLAVIGAVVGLAVFSRFVNGLLGVLVGGLLVLGAPRGQRWRTVGMGLGIAAPVAVLLGVALWPRLWDAPVTHLLEAWAKLRKPHSAEPFLGVITNTPPRVYFAVYLGATAPLGVLLAAGAWLARALVRGRREARASLTLLLWLAVPMLVALSPVRQDGVRYVMPCLLALAVMAAAGVDGVAAGLAAWRGWRTAVRARLFAALAMALGGYLLVVDARVHPYYLDYYGEHVGGPTGVAERSWFEVAWWGEGIADAIDYVNEHAKEGARVFKGCVEPGHLTWLRADLWPREARSAAAADWSVVYQPAWRDCPMPEDARLVHEVRAQGAPLVRVYRRGDGAQ